ncbi:hypothetical protein [Sphingobium cloacae]|nr:hypothetical protein [Sphingobium cloacae]
MDSALELARAGHRTAETIAASQDVIEARSDLIRTALRSPLEADYHELALMVPEKVEAFSKAGSAIVGQWWAIHADALTQAQHLGAMAFRGRPPTAAEWNAMTARTIAHGVRALERSVALGAGAVKPVHARATANARRLKRMKKR